jgi:PEP-CTERM motif
MSFTKLFLRMSTCRPLLSALALLAVASGMAQADTISIGLTKVGAPTWKVADFQLFTAPADPFPDAFFHTLDLMLPLEGPGATTYTPHAGPYDHELSTNGAAAGFVNQQVFPKSAITDDPNGVYFMFMMLPDPGITGSSRDFASGPVIPNSLFPMHSHAEMWLNGALVETLQDQDFNPRAGDMGFTGASHRAPSQAVWWPWANDPNAGPTGSHELRWSIRDNQGYGWDMSAPFTVVPEPSALVVALVGAGGASVFRRRKRIRGTSGRR